MNPRGIFTRASTACQRRAARWFGRRLFTIPAGRAVISFTFDDFPRSALDNGGSILRRHQFSATYYVSLGIAGQPTSPCGELFTVGDLHQAVAQGHELGCHTFAHCPAWETTPAAFEESICRNADTLQCHLPQTAFRTLSYPISYPRPATKLRAGRHFCCCRGGGQTFNTGTVDLNYVSAFFLEQSTDNLAAVEHMIATNQAAGGWLIFATHDVSDRPTRFGCTPDFFARVVDLATASGASVLPVGQAWDELSNRSARRTAA